MMKLRRIAISFSSVAILAVMGIPAQAQATRTWVSGVGDDANPCSRTAPCKTFAGAISKTTASGEIDALDPGGFGAITITKAITIANDGVGSAGVLVSGTNGIVINAGVADTVILRGLDINGLSPAAGAGVNGVNIVQAGKVLIDSCKIYDFQQSGVNFVPDNNGAQLSIVNTVIYNNGSSGGALGNFGNVLIQPTGAGVSVSASLDRVQLLGGFKPGLRVDGSQSTGTSTVSVRNSLAMGNGGAGFAGQTEAPDNGEVILTIDSSTAANNSGFGVHSTGTNSTVYLSNTTITQNGSGVGTSSGNVVSLGNNAIIGNLIDGAPSSSMSLQ